MIERRLPVTTNGSTGWIVWMLAVCWVSWATDTQLLTDNWAQFSWRLSLSICWCLVRGSYCKKCGCGVSFFNRTLLDLNIFKKPQIQGFPFSFKSKSKPVPWYGPNHVYHDNRILLPVVDHSARWSRKNAASCVNRCEMQDTPSTRHSNAYCSLGTSSSFVCLSVVNIAKKHRKTCCRVDSVVNSSGSNPH